MALTEPFRKPVFVVGAPRSGTTLAYSVLLASGAFPLYEAESRIVECQVRYGSLSRQDNFEQFLSDFRQSRQFVRSGIEWDAFARGAEAHRGSYIEMLSYLMQSICGLQGKTRWMEKTPNHVLYMDALAAAFPDALFVHAIRDGRDVALSQRKLGMASNYSDDPLIQLVWAGKIWAELVRAGRASGRRLGARYLELHYRDVVGDLEGQLERLNRFGKLEITPEKVEATTVSALGRSNTAFADPMKGISNKGLERWRETLSPEELATLEWAIGERLEELGYEREADPSVGVSLRARLHGLVAVPAMRAKRFLNKHTFLRHYASKPLDIGET